MRDLPFLVFLAAVVLSLLRARDLPSVELAVGGADVSIGPVDLALVATAVLAAWRLRVRRTLPSRGLVLASGAFALLIVVSALPNGADALTSAGRLAELFALTLGAVAFLDTRDKLGTLLAVLVAFCVVAVSWGAIEFVTGGGGRQGSFMGEHDLAALGTLALVAGLAVVYSQSATIGATALAGIVAGGLAIALGASLASLLGLYLAAAALVAVALVRRSLRRNARACDGRARRRRDRDDGDATQRRARFPPGVVRPGARAARPVRGELEPAPDLRVRGGSRLSRQPDPRHWLARRAAPEEYVALSSPMRARRFPDQPPTLLREPRADASSRSRPTTRC